MKTAIISITILGLLSGGCASSNLAFVDQNKIAISLSGSVPDQKVDITVGYSDNSVALVPVVSTNGGVLMATNGGSADALSVFARFAAKGGINTNAGSFEIGRVFATGLAAQKVAEFYARAITNAAH